MSLKLKDIMSEHAHYLSANTSLHTACAEMHKKDLGFLPIKEEGNIIGVITDRDIAVRGMGRGLDPNATVDKVMSNNVVTALETDTLETAVRLMEEKQIRRLVILDKNRSFCGVVSLGDIATKCNDNNLCGTLIGAVSEKFN